MLTTIALSLLCSHFIGSTLEMCEAMTLTAVITPSEDGIWELLPLCPEHLDVLVLEVEEGVASPPHTFEAMVCM